MIHRQIERKRKKEREKEIDIKLGIYRETVRQVDRKREKKENDIYRLERLNGQINVFFFLLFITNKCNNAKKLYNASYTILKSIHLPQF